MEKVEVKKYNLTLIRNNIGIIYSGKIGKYKYFTGEKALLFRQSQVINKPSLHILFWEKLSKTIQNN